VLEWLPGWFPRVLAGAIEALQEEIQRMSDNLQSEIQSLRDEVAAQGSVMASAETLLQGLHDQLEAALSAAQGQGGIDPASLQQLHDLSAQLAQQTQALAQAVEANTPSQQPGDQGGTGPTGDTGGDTGATGATGATGGA
jgi:DNA repair exonuclease SbcCD ATPase subunit